MGSLAGCMEILLNLGRWAGSLGKLSNKTHAMSSNLKFYDHPGEFYRKNLPAWRNSQEYQLAWCRYGGISPKIVNLRFKLRNVGTCYVNSGQNNQKDMRFWGQSAETHRHIIDFKGQCQQKHRKSIEI